MGPTLRAFVAVSLLAGAAAAVAEPRPADPAARARALFAEGDSHFRLREYDQAIARFKEAYRLEPAPLLLFNLAQAYRLAGDCRQAAWFYDRFAHSGADAAAIAAAEAQRTAMRRCVARLDATAAAGRPAARRSALAWVGVGVGVAGVAAVAGGAGFAYRAGDQAAQRDAACGDADGCTASQARGFDDAGRTASRAAIGLFTAGGVMIAGGVTMYVLGRRGPRVTIRPRDGGATLALGWAL